MNESSSTPMVTVICTAYNHEKYIRKCLDGFIMQKTQFPFEVIVHDDASKDHTANIIKEYANQYPEIIKPILQKENQRSKGVKIVLEYAFPLIQGKYVALCEGDDYWCDPNKLQKQVEALESHSDCHLCLTRVRQIKEDGTLTKKSMPSFKMKTGVYSTEDFLILDQGHNFQTASYFFVADDYRFYIQNPPSFRRVVKVGDAPVLLFFSSLGNVYYYDDCMACHRQGSVGSWSSRISASDQTKKDEHYLSMIRMFSLFDEYSDNQYHDIISGRIRRTEFDRLLLYENYKEALSKENTAFFRSMPIKLRTKIIIGAVFPGALSVFKNRRKKNER